MTSGPLAGRLRTGVRRHGAFLALLVLGIVVRAVVMVAYRPAMYFTDSIVYLNRAVDLQLSAIRPIGYSFLLRLIQTVTDSTAAVALVQHLGGVLLAVACYAFLLRRAVPRWGAALATLPLLFDPLQLVLEHYVLSDVFFEVLLVAACLTMLWRRRPGPGALLAVGLLVAAAGLVRGAGQLILPVFLVALLCLRPRWTAVAAFLVGAAVPLVTYAAVFDHQHGSFSLGQAGPRFLYSRLAPFTPCSDIAMPEYERPLCPPEPVASRPNANTYMWAAHSAAQWHLRPPAGMKRVHVVADFDKRIIRAQPLLYARLVVADIARGFAPVRTYEVPGFPASYWLFQDHYWSADTFANLQGILASGKYGAIGYDPAAASAMTTYRKVVFTPGPVMAVLLLLSVVAVAGAGRARLSGDRVAVGLLSLSCLMALITTAALQGFSWRYQLPGIALLPTAGALATRALLVGRGPGTPDPLPPLRILDRAAAATTRLPVPRRWRPALEGAVRQGSLQVVLAVLAATVVGAAVALLAAASGWANPGTATVLGAVAGAFTLTVLLVARRRALRDERTAETGA